MIHFCSKNITWNANKHGFVKSNNTKLLHITLMSQVNLQYTDGLTLPSENNSFTCERLYRVLFLNRVQTWSFRCKSVFCSLVPFTKLTIFLWGPKGQSASIMWNKHLTVASKCPQKLGFPLCSTFECNKMSLVPLQVSVCWPLPLAALVEGWMAHRELLYRTTLFAHHTGWNHSPGKVSSLLSAEGCLTSSVVFLPDTRQCRWTQTVVVSLRHSEGPSWKTCFLWVSVWAFHLSLPEASFH